ncbi:DNA-binding transcriptional regulator HcaR [Clavibacter michiganensis subsp. michiganensis]|uniref:DNA-binding transcriptional regulator HcaR n=1 Tax=Clavibacter michiganensis subsp. michiganensis TaxID=33013 RepID=A0A251XIP2_CLAMM|nr:DNA-binding transcriptional regulator HcaR [Clavibacter michiganensis subsp. michiganensis]OUE02501.1 DNA-binding transcriptional regulator HcaR [Clavibacter michiganensis subsp. michiganensis]
MKISHQRHFVVAAEVLHHPKAADQLGISRAKLASSIRAIEEHYGRAVFDPQSTETRLTKTGRLAYEEAIEELAKPSTRPRRRSRRRAGRRRPPRARVARPSSRASRSPTSARRGAEAHAGALKRTQGR